MIFNYFIIFIQSHFMGISQTKSIVLYKVKMSQSNKMLQTGLNDVFGCLDLAEYASFQVHKGKHWFSTKNFKGIV